jgi:LmbE family N-acetylglucosaminyl deacetylase/SAM-dependent methyltransferase
VSFDHLVTGTPESVWAASPELREARELGPITPGTAVLVIAAHPDDETLGAGGLLVSAAALNCPVTVLIATDGDASHPNSTTHTRAQLAAIRRAEVSAAVGELAASARVVFLGLPDGRLEDHDAQLDIALRAIIEPDSIVVVPWSHDRHPDHEACGRIGQRIAADTVGVRLLEYPIWVWHWAQPGAGQGWQPDGPPVTRLRRLPLSPAVQQAKSRALAHHRSQVAPLSARPGDEAILPEPIMAHFRRSFEVFVESAPAEQASYFDRLYDGADDPWELGTRFYETRKRRLLLDVLPRERYRRAFEPGCATGLLTLELARRCEELRACDVAGRAVEQTRERVRGFNVQVEPGSIPDYWPDGQLDLIVISEVGYYCPDLSELRARVEQSLAPDGVVVACHWRHPAPDHPHTAEDVHAALGHDLASIVNHVEDDFLLQVWGRRPGSTARAGGII